jgi:hypothetical protein
MFYCFHVIIHKYICKFIVLTVIIAILTFIIQCTYSPYEGMCINALMCTDLILVVSKSLLLSHVMQEAVDYVKTETSIEKRLCFVHRL